MQTFHWRSIASRLAAICLCLTFLFTGCGHSLRKPATTEEDGSSGKEATGFVEERGSGKIEYGDTAGPLAQEQEALLLAYMNLYYESLARLAPQDPGSLFSNEQQAEVSRSGISLQIGLRKMQHADYSLVSYQYTLTCLEITQGENESIQILAEEENVQNFAQNPEISTESYGIKHTFTLERQEKTWYIRRHRKMDTLYTLLLHADENEAELDDRYTSSVPGYLEQVKNDTAAREAEQRGRAVSLPAARHPYDRNAALDYAGRYVKARNGKWADYGPYGGNCQNYTSQCLLAGGIPMDAYGDHVWKWYGSTVSNRSGTSGRSSSWSGVSQFLEYAQHNKGYGLAAAVNAPYFTGEPGDLLQMGTEHGWQHTAIIASAVRDAAGNTVDYLVHSNTGDLKNYPASLFGFPKMSLTRIAGWND